jgi:hypothetical protein
MPEVFSCESPPYVSISKAKNPHRAEKVRQNAPQGGVLFINLQRRRRSQFQTLTPAALLLLPATRQAMRFNVGKMADLCCFFSFP